MSNLNKRAEEAIKRINESKEETIKRGKAEFEKLKANIPLIKERAEIAKQRILKDLKDNSNSSK